MYVNPVINQDFPDPNCIKFKDTYYAFATNFGEMQAGNSHIQVAISKDLVSWQLQSDAMPKLPRWAKPGKTWAPNVTHVTSGASDVFVLYFVAWDIESDLQALCVATSKNPEGPYECSADKPFMLQVKLPHPATILTVRVDVYLCPEQMLFAKRNLQSSRAQHTYQTVSQDLHESCFPGRSGWDH